MVFGLCSEVFEYGLFPEPLHEIPVLDDTMPDGPFDGIGCTVEGLVPYKEVQIFDPFAESTDGLVAHFGGFLNGDTRGHDELRLGVAGKAHLCVPEIEWIRINI